jgi:hypothetical protein
MKEKEGEIGRKRGARETEAKAWQKKCDHR